MADAAVQLINRNEIVTAMQYVSAGLGKQGLGPCFAFREGMIYANNEDIACRAPVPFQWEGAIQAKALMEVLSRWTDDYVKMSVKEGHMVLSVPKPKDQTTVGTKRAKLVIEQDMDLELWKAPDPETWTPLHPHFLDGLEAVRSASAKAKSNEEFLITCVHIAKTWVEATDTEQMARYRVPTRVSLPEDGSSLLIPAQTVRHIVGLGVSEVGQVPGYLCFRNESGVEAAVQTHEGAYPNLTPLLEGIAEHPEMLLPGGLKDVWEACKGFVLSTADDQFIQVTLAPGLVKLTAAADGVGVYTQTKPSNYSGGVRVFRVNPEFLGTIISKGKMILAPLGQSTERLVVVEDRSIYVAVASTPDAEGGDE
jgi:hypothetical protein